MKAALTLLVGAICLASVHGQSLNDRSVGGVLFYKQHDFEPDTKSVWPIEYRSAASNNQIMVITARSGKRLRLRPQQVEIVISYPGRDNMTRDEALGLCDLALERFPQHSQIIRNIRLAWEQTPIPLPKYQVGGKPKTPPKPGAIEVLWAGIVTKAGQIKDAVAQKFAQWTTPKATPAPTPAPVIADTPSKDQTLDLEKNLKIIDNYYKKSAEIEREIGEH